MISDQNLSEISSKKQLLAIVENLMNAEFGRTGLPWVDRQRLCQLFLDGYYLDLEALIEFKSHSQDLRSLLVNSKRFAIYNKPQPKDYYVALRSLLAPF
ncbi:MAG: hypothetical protein WBG32_24680 [Nodosilinea sp.]